MFSLQGKAAVVTGGGRGIVRAIAPAYAEEDADVVLTSRNEKMEKGNRPTPCSSATTKVTGPRLCLC